MKTNKNSRRFAEQAREALAQIILFELNDPHVEFVTVTACDVSVDKSYIQAYVTTDSPHTSEAVAALNRAKGRIRSELGKRLHWRVTPKIDFMVDPATEAAERLSYALENVPPTLRAKEVAPDDGALLHKAENQKPVEPGEAGSKAERDEFKKKRKEFNKADGFSVKEDA